MNWNIIIISLSVLLFVFAIIKEVRRPNRARLTLRIFAVILAVAALACLALPLTYKKAIQENSDTKLTLLTPGFNKDSLKDYSNAPLCTFDSSVNKNYPKAKLVADIHEAATDADKRKLHVFGYGLTEDELARLHKTFVFHPSSLPDGVTALHYTNQINTGDKLQVQGIVKNTSDKPISFILKGLGTTLDSTQVTPGNAQLLTLGTTPKQTGRTVYHLLGLVQGDTLCNEMLPVTITQAAPLRLLLLSSSPDFESKFLKNWLVANGYAVASRSLISKGKYSQELINMPSSSLNQITSGLLEKFDLVISDVMSVSALSTTESSILQREITDKGLGLIIRADSADKLTNWATRNFALGRIAGRPAAGVLKVAGTISPSAKLELPSIFINQNNNQQVLVHNVQGQTLAANTLSGSGKIAITVINNTYNWMLAGSKADYATLWSAIINKTARKQNVENSGWVSPQFPAIGEAVQITTAGNAAVNGISIATKQNPNVPFEQSGTYWPGTVGWQQTTSAGGKPYWWFSWPENSWTGVKAAQKLSATQAFTATHSAAQSVTKQIQEFEQVAVPKIYFYILFLMALAFLWSEAKYSGY